MPIDNNYLQYNKVYPNKHQQFHISKISGNPNINIDASNIVIDASLISINGDIDLSGNIIPTINETFDLGTPEFRFRDLFLSNASIWFGDENKISINTNGKFSSKKRKTNIIPAFIRNHENGHSNITDLLNYYFGSGHSKTINDMKLKDWKAYTIRRGIRSRKTFDISEVFSDSTSDDWERIVEGINESDLLTSLSNLNIDISNNNFDFSGNLIVNGNISATTFYGDGSNLTGISSGAANSDSPSFSQLSLGNTGVNQGILNLQDVTNIGTDTIAQIKGIKEGTNGGEIQIFTKVDGGSLTEKITINNQGAIGIGGANYGTSGQVLTSNGSGALPSWNEPYYFGASLTGDQSVPSNSEVDINFEPYLASPYDGNNSDMTSGIWTCPQTGLYRVSLNVIVSTAGDDIRSSDIWIYFNDTREAGAKYFNNTNDDIQVGTLNCETLVALSIGNKIKGAGRIVISSGGGRTFEQYATYGGKGTTLHITRVI